MATVQRVFDTLDTSTFLDGGSEANVDVNGQNSEFIDLSTWEGCHCFVDVDFVSGPTDDLVIEVLSTNDGTNFDTIPLFSFTVDNTNDNGRVSWVVTSVYGFRAKFKASGSTDSINIMFRYRKWRWETV